MHQQRFVRSVALFVKENNLQARELSEKVGNWLESHGIKVQYRRCSNAPKCCEVVPQVDLALAFGGDGTIVSIAKELIGSCIPVAGVNFGKVGFLTEIPPQDWEPSMQSLLEHGIYVEPRMTLAYTLLRDDDVLLSGEVINDVVITRGKLARLADFALSAEDTSFLLRADGIIFSTPTGSTGYSRSAGGPILHAAMCSYVVAAICPFLSSFPPLVLDSDMLFSVTVGLTNTDVYLTLDGHEVCALREGDRLEVYGRDERFYMANLGVTGYFERLRSAGFVHEERLNR